MHKNFVKEASAIVILSLLLAITYNYFSAKPLPLIAEAPIAVSNNLLESAAAVASNNVISIPEQKSNSTSDLIKEKTNKDSTKQIKNLQNLKKIIYKKLLHTNKLKKR
jgi:hypothetical protein